MILDEMMIDVDFNGIVVFAYPGLLNFFDGKVSEGRNILASFTETDLGDAVVDAGVVIPITNIDDGGYLLRFLGALPMPSPQRKVIFSDEGYVLCIESELFAADAAVFWEWEDYLGWRKVNIDAGTYAVTLQGVQHLSPSGTVVQVGYDLVLTKRDQLPVRTAVLRSDSRVLV